MEYGIGILVAVVVALIGAVIGFGRDRAYYPTVLIVTASYYVLFAVMGGSTRALALEAIPMAAFTALAILGFKRSGWLVAIGLFGHALFDLTHHHVIENPGVPPWWPGFCLAIDVTLGAFIAGCLLRSRGDGTAP